MVIGLGAKVVAWSTRPALISTTVIILLLC